ncbi:MAG: hypothetical protein ACMXYE_02085 [Candidatus Woesearchaeota archaeon]
MTKKKDTQEDYTKKIMIFFGIIVIIVIALLFTPRLFTSEPKTLDELHLENYESPPTDRNYIYNGYSFIKFPEPGTNVEMWYTQYARDGYLFDLPMRHGPKDVENINKRIISPIPQGRNFTQMYITIDPKPREISRQYLTLAISEFSKKMTEVRQYPLVAACTRNETDACLTRPIVACESDHDNLIMYFKEVEENNPPRITIDGTCITIQGHEEELIKATYRVIYELLGIIRA